MKKNLYKKIFSLATAFCVVCSLAACQPEHDDAPTPKVILFIGDGMGPNHVYNSELYYGEDAYFSSFETKTLVDTNSLTGTTDSAAAATAMATETRVDNGYVAYDGTENLDSITELAKEARYGTGVITSDSITGATPAGFSAHAGARSDDESILTTQAQSKLDLLLGSGYVTYESYFEDGWTWVTRFDSLNLKKKRFVGAFYDVVPEETDDPTTPTLTQLAEFSIDYMEKNYSSGYFLMIEGAKIDKASHSNDIDAMLENFYDFNSAIKAVDEKLKATGDDYSIIVTADHETGSLAKATDVSEIGNNLYGSDEHSNVPVGLYFQSTLACTPTVLESDLILNTDIFSLCKYLLALD